MGKTIFIGARKGGVGKTMTTASLGVGLAREGKRILVIDTDSQFSLTVSLGISEPDKLPITLATVMNNIINETYFEPSSGIIHHSDGVDLLPANSSLTGIELALAPLIGREAVLRQYIDMVKPMYDYILIDTPPSLDLLTINALAAANSAIIPVVPRYLDTKGLELLLRSISQVRRQINPNLSISGILLTMVDKRANFTREIIALIENAYGDRIRIFNENIPHSIKAVESTAQGVSIFTYDPRGKVAAAYAALTEEVLEVA
jgi:chromosome partitioning protein